MKHNLKDILNEHNITQKELARKSGISEVGLSRMLNSGNAQESTLKKIACALGVEMDELVKKEVVLKAKFGSDKTPLRIGHIELPCYVLDNGMRVFSGRGIQKLIGAGEKSSGQWLQRFVNSNPISGYLLAGTIEAFNHPLMFYRNGASGSQTTTYGYEATLLIDLCNAIIDAYDGRENGINKVYYDSASTIVRAVAKVGIIALVDEATGYNKEKTKAKDELQKFLKQFLLAEAAKWVKTFPDQFFEDLYKMHGWNWNYTTKRPGVVGTWINKIVYERLGPITETLNERNPKNENGNRLHKHHQFLSQEVALPQLRDLLASIHTLTVISNYDWNKFLFNLDKVYPVKNQQLFLFDDYDDLR